MANDPPLKASSFLPLLTLLFRTTTFL
jgi:hypothetical protein